MEEARIQAETREGRGKGPARRLRMLNRIPAVLYGRDVSPVALSVSSKDWRVLEAHARSNAVIRMDLRDGGKAQERPVMVKHVQKRPVDESVLHIDFLQVSMERAVQVEVPIHLVGDPLGVAKGGVVEQHVRTVMIESLPGQIPERIDVDISNLDIGDSIHIARDFPARRQAPRSPRRSRCRRYPARGRGSGGAGRRSAGRRRRGRRSEGGVAFFVPCLRSWQ